MAARRPFSRIPSVAARRPARHTSPQHGVARNCHQSPDYAINPRRARVCANSQPSLFTIACTPATYRPLTYCTEAPHELQSVLLPKNNLHASATLCFRSRRPLTRPVYLPPKRLRLDAEGALHVLAQASAFSRQACLALQIWKYVAVAAAVRLMSPWCMTLVEGVADCYFAQGLSWPILIMLRPIESVILLERQGLKVVATY